MDLRPSSEVKAQIAKQFLVVGDWVRKFGVVEIGFWHRTAPRGARRRSLVISASRTIFQAALVTQILDPRGCWHALPMASWLCSFKTLRSVSQETEHGRAREVSVSADRDAGQ